MWHHFDKACLLYMGLDVEKEKQSVYIIGICYINCVSKHTTHRLDNVKALNNFLFISLIRMRSKRDIKMGRLCTPGGAVLGIVGGGVRFRFFKWRGYF